MRSIKRLICILVGHRFRLVIDDWLLDYTYCTRCLKIRISVESGE